MRALGGIMKSEFGLIAVGLAVTTAVAQTKPMHDPLSLPEGNYPGELLAAMLCGAVIGAGTAFGSGFAYAAVQHSTFSVDGPGFQVGAALGYPFGCGLGTILCGKSSHGDGNNGAAYGGAYAGLALGALAGLVTGKWEVAIPPMVLLPPVCAYVAYRLGRTEFGWARAAAIDKRLLAPGMSLALAELPDHSVQYGVKAQLVGLRF
jgi:hypothetical protein